MNVWGITGGVGMGKSTAGELLALRGVRVVDTDVLARELTEPGTVALEEIKTAFGSEIMLADGRLDRKGLAELVFGDLSARVRLESILHPRIAAAWRSRLDQWKISGVMEAAVLIPLLFERGYQAEFTAVVAVACTESTQRKRLFRRGWADDQIDSRNSAQLPVADKMARARYVVWTEGTLSTHERQWDRILARTSGAEEERH
ncbi:MAG TPA: dephospho-CoA kinase [Verrucomicrobiota bacterium]|nr:dephospho-CoA kinase [Verrucomicrobiota bacterium]